MARKETPDLLGELLAGPDDAQELAPAARPASAPSTRRSRPARKSAPPAPPPASPPRWEYLLISFSDYHGWRPRYINGREVRSWTEAPVIHEYVAQLGEDGWEMVGASGGKNLYGHSDHHQLYFKRSRHEDS